MSLHLNITSYHKMTPGQVIEKSLIQGSMAIGRALENDWVLPDPQYLVAKTHCVIQYRDCCYYIVDCSTDGVELLTADVRLKSGDSERLENGEIIRVGDYEISVCIDHVTQKPQTIFVESEPVHSFEVLMEHQSAMSPVTLNPVSNRSFPDASDAGVGEDLFDFLTPRSAVPATRPDHVPVEYHDFRPPAPRQSTVSVAPSSPVIEARVIPEDWDLVAEVSSDQASEQRIDAQDAYRVAMKAGVTGALQALLKRFEPAELEARWDKPMGWSRIFNVRQATQWHQFTERYTEIAREAEADFHSVFDREFSRAYEAYCAGLRPS